VLTSDYVIGPYRPSRLIAASNRASVQRGQGRLDRGGQAPPVVLPGLAERLKSARSSHAPPLDAVHTTISPGSLFGLEPVMGQAPVLFISMIFHAAAALAARPATSAAVPSDGHATLYETCAVIVIAVIVVLYFDESVRRNLSPQLRGSAIGWLGGILTIGVFTPLLALAGFISDSKGAREATVGFTTLFLIAAFGNGAVRTWGLEDGRRLRNPQPAPPPVPPAPPVPIPSPHLTERERAAEVLGYAFATVTELAGSSVALTAAPGTLAGPELLIDRTRVAEYLRNWAARWGELHPRLIAIVIGYPSPAVREHADAFRQAAMRAVALTLRLATSGESLEEKARDQLAAETAAEYATADDAATALIRALHPEDDNGAEPSARNGRGAKNRAVRQLSPKRNHRSHSPMNRRRHANVARLRKIQRQQASNAAKPQ
jgi:hypothetical protein